MILSVKDNNYDRALQCLNTFRSMLSTEQYNHLWSLIESGELCSALEIIDAVEELVGEIL